MNDREGREGATRRISALIALSLVGVCFVGWNDPFWAFYTDLIGAAILFLNGMLLGKELVERLDP